MELYFKGPAPGFHNTKTLSDKSQSGFLGGCGAQERKHTTPPQPYPKGRVLEALTQNQKSQSGAKNRFSMKIKEMIDENLVQELRTGIRLRADKKGISS